MDEANKYRWACLNRVISLAQDLTDAEMPNAKRQRNINARDECARVLRLPRPPGDMLANLYWFRSCINLRLKEFQEAFTGSSVAVYYMPEVKRYKIVQEKTRKLKDQAVAAAEKQAKKKTSRQRKSTGQTSREDEMHEAANERAERNVLENEPKEVAGKRRPARYSPPPKRRRVETTSKKLEKDEIDTCEDSRSRDLDRTSGAKEEEIPKSTVAERAEEVEHTDREGCDHCPVEGKISPGQLAENA
ncbi:MAG: hypothetical protein Q9218_008019 [Villophora microphyllina]